MERILNDVIPSIGITDILDILIVAFIIYKILGFIRETRAEQLAKGLLLLLAATLASQWLHFYTLHWILSGLTTVGLIAIVVIFQPELRRGLEYIGRSKLLNLFGVSDKESSKTMTAAVAEAIENFSSSKTGALIVFERETTLTDIVETGTVIDADVTAQLLGTIFYVGTPLHDGALIVRGTRAHAAGCVLPLTQNRDLSYDLGTRHRAGIGISENSDAYVIIVSEETGIISVAQNGKLRRFLDAKTVEKELLAMYMDSNQGTFISRLTDLFKKPEKKEEDDAEKQ